jgi:hypothetical protein
MSLHQDVSCLSIPFGKSGIRRGDVIERCRKTLVGALKTGSTFVLYLGTVNIEHVSERTIISHHPSLYCTVLYDGDSAVERADY